MQRMRAEARRRAERTKPSQCSTGAEARSVGATVLVRCIGLDDGDNEDGHDHVDDRHDHDNEDHDHDDEETTTSTTTTTSPATPPREAPRMEAHESLFAEGAGDTFTNGRSSLRTVAGSRVRCEELDSPDVEVGRGRGRRRREAMGRGEEERGRGEEG